MNDINKYDISDLVAAAANQKPLDFEAAFNDLIVDRISNAINDKKISVAQQMYGYNTTNEEESED
jgi:hypothetical protein